MITIDQIIAEKLGSWYIGEWPIGNFMLCLIALVLCVLLCGIIGVEREKRGRSAGLRTHLLVGVGSCIIMIISIYGFPAMFGDHRDVARLAAQVITGVGFLGAGAIIHKSSGTRGLTTAGTIWIVMAIGLGCGSMNFVLALSGTIIIVIVLTVFRRFENTLTKKAPLIMIKAKSDSHVVTKILEMSNTTDCSVEDLRVDLGDEGHLEVTFLAVSKSNHFNTAEFVSKLDAIEGVISVGVLNSHKA